MTNPVRKALVLGGNKGLGLGTARALGSAGVEVGIVGRDAGALAAAKESIAGRPETFQGDLTDRMQIDALLASVRKRLGKIDILLLNGGGPAPFAAASFDHDLWLSVFQSMVLNQMHIATSLLPDMRAAGWGRILIVASTSIREPISGLTASNALRAALAGWAKTLAGEVARDGVTVNVLMPGRIATDRTTRLDALDAAERGVDPSVIAAQSQAEVPIGRYGTIEEFGAVADFLASDGGSYVTGTAIPIDGGLSHSL